MASAARFLLEQDTHIHQSPAQMIVYITRLLLCEYDGNMHIPKGQTPPNKESEDTNMTKNEERINKLFEELVPASGKAESLAGELIRAMSRIAYRFYNDGDQVGMGYGKETCNPAARFLMAKGNKRVSSLATAIWGIYDESAYEDLLDILAGAVADHVEQTPDLRTTPTDDMWDYSTDEDVDDREEEEDDYEEEDYDEDEEDY